MVNIGLLLCEVCSTFPLVDTFLIKSDLNLFLFLITFLEYWQKTFLFLPNICSIQIFCLKCIHIIIFPRFRNSEKLLITVLLLKEILILFFLTLTNLTSLVTKLVLLTLETHYFPLPFTNVEFTLFYLQMDWRQSYCFQAPRALA